MLKFGCLSLLLAVCATVGVLIALLQTGPLALSLPGGNTLRIGADSTVVSNYSFQNGTTYFVDLDGNGVRTILEVRHLTDRHTIEVAVHSASRGGESDRTLFDFPVP